MSASLIETDFSAFLAWRDWDYADKNWFSIFGSAVVRSREGHILFGKMAVHTSGAGLLYPPAGSLEPGDVDAVGQADVFASAARELKEETGLDAAGAIHEGDFVAQAGQLISINRVLRYDMLAVDLVRQVRDFIALQEKSELEDVVVISQLQDIGRMKTKHYAVRIAEYLLV